MYEKQKELLGKDDLTEKHSHAELREMLRELEDRRRGNEAARELESREEECRGVERAVERLRRKANDLNSKKGKLEAEGDAHRGALKERFRIMEEVSEGSGRNSPYPRGRGAVARSGVRARGRFASDLVDAYLPAHPIVQCPADGPDRRARVGPVARGERF